MKKAMGLLVFMLSFVFLSSLHASSDNFVVLDVRTPEEYNLSHVKGALNVDFHAANFQENILKLDKSKAYKVYCRSGNRSGQALTYMKSVGFKDVENLGGLNQAATKLSRSCDGAGPC